MQGRIRTDAQLGMRTLPAALKLKSDRVYRRDTYEISNGVFARAHVHATCIQLAPVRDGPIPQYISLN